MICPCCDTINNDDAKVCRSCGIRLTGRRARPEDVEREKKYLKAGIAAVVGLIAFLTIVIMLSSCICSGCHDENAGENVITDEVGGEYFDETVSESDYLTSSADVSSADVSSADAGEDAPAE